MIVVFHVTCKFTTLVYASQAILWKVTMSDKKKAEVPASLNARVEGRDFATIKELSQRIGKCYRTVHRAAQAGKIKTVRFGASRLIPRAEVERILQRGF